MCHPSRVLEAEKLYRKLKKMPWVSVAFVSDRGTGEWETGKSAILERYNMSDYHLVIQDDAIIGESFYQNALAALEAVPTKSLVSFYLGRVRPNRQTVEVAFERAMTADKSFLIAKTLLWGVCIAIPTEDISNMLQFSKMYPKLLYDNRIGQYYLVHKRPVYYTKISLVDHNDDLPSIAGSKKSKAPRVAHQFVGDDLISFNSEVEEIR